MTNRFPGAVAMASVLAGLLACGGSAPGARTATRRAPPSTDSGTTTDSVTAVGDTAVGDTAPYDSDDPADVIRRYYAAIAEKDYRRAYELWGNAGAASGKTYDQFASGFAETATVHVEIGALGRIEGAAGSRYVDVPVTIDATTAAGRHQRFEGSYTLRRSVIEGSTPAQRRWHIDSAHIVGAS